MGYGRIAYKSPREQQLPQLISVVAGCMNVDLAKISEPANTHSLSTHRDARVLVVVLASAHINIRRDVLDGLLQDTMSYSQKEIDLARTHFATDIHLQGKCRQIEIVISPTRRAGVPPSVTPIDRLKQEIVRVLNVPWQKILDDAPRGEKFLEATQLVAMIARNTTIGIDDTTITKEAFHGKGKTMQSAYAYAERRMKAVTPFRDHVFEICIALGVTFLNSSVAKE